MGKLQSKAAVITGGGTGIGSATAKLFAQEGARIAIIDWSRNAGEATVAAINKSGGEAHFIEANVSEPDQMEEAIGEAATKLRALHILHNNAGGSSARDGIATDLPIDEWWRTIKVDLFGTFLGCRFAIPFIANSGGGAIINMTSVRAIVGSKGAAAYSAAKGGIISLTKALAPECAEDNIRINAIAPGAIKTERVKKLLDKAEETGNDMIVARHLLGLGEPEDVANLALFLASDEARLITGAIVPVDSGTSAT